MCRCSIVWFVLAVLVSTGAFASDPNLVRLATTTTTESSGLLDLLVPAFEASSGYRMKLTIVGSGRALRLARLGKVDAVLVHAPAAEQVFIEKGWGVRRRLVMKNDFVLVGPAGDPAGIRGMHNAGDALKKIVQSKATFVSRGDDSGTHKKELRCWAKAGIQPAGEWYYESGSAMGDTLKLASERMFYTLVDRGTWFALRGGSALELLVEGDPELENVYGVIEVNPKRYPDVNSKGAMAFSDWLLSPEGQGLILGYQVGGERLYFPVNRSDD